MNRATIVLLAGLLPPLASAQEIKLELGVDAVHARGLRAWSVSVENEHSRFRTGSFGQDGIEVRFFGAEYVWRPSPRWSLSLGVVHLDHLTPLNGTYWNFQGGLQYRATPNVFIGFLHISHGGGLGIAPDEVNNGFNFLTAGTVF